MTRIVSDKNGDYDLAHVSCIRRVPQKEKIGNGQTRDLPAMAQLHFESGQTVSTLLPYEATRAQWLQVKSAEGHPVETTQRATQQ